VSKSRAKRKRARRATAGGGGAAGGGQRAGGGGAGARGRATAGAAGAAPRGERRRGGQHATQRAEPAGRPSRIDVRDGVARPDAIWSPFPLTEIGMALGLVIFVAGLASDGRRATWLLSVAVGVLVVVVGELCLREHLGGFRSHALLLAVLPVTIAHVVVVVAVSDAWTGPSALAVDLALAGALAWLLRARFRVARERARGLRERAP
jgi:hypothetical protein